MNATDEAVAAAVAATKRYVWPRWVTTLVLVVLLGTCGAVIWTALRVAQVDASRRAATQQTQVEIVAAQRQRAHDICEAFDTENEGLRTSLHTFAAGLSAALPADTNPAIFAAITKLESELDAGLPITPCPPGSAE